MELLAPAGSFQSLRAAVQSGADAVYIGGSRFSARRSAVNFSLDEISEAVKYCHLRGVKLHVAANILVKEKEKEDFLEYIGELNDIGIDAVIIQDIGMSSAIGKMYPDLPLHASTQMTVTNVSGAEKLAEMGFSRIVLARELSLDAIEKICRSVNVETEVFAHGAICMSYSGQCLMSSIIGGRSGNRGMCAQPCRLPYSIKDKKGYLLSPKDLCAANHLDELKKIGVTSLKIEGRLKRSEYVAAVSGVYRRCLDEGRNASAEDINELTRAFSRSGFTDGYLTDNLGRDMMCYNNPSNSAENSFSAEVKARCAENANLKTSAVYMSGALKKDCPLVVSVWDENGRFASAESILAAETAKNKPIDAERLIKQLGKTGATPFHTAGVEAEVDDGITIPISEINSTRRLALERFSEQLRAVRERRKLKYTGAVKKHYGGAPVLTAQVYSYEQAKVCVEKGITEIYADTRLANRLFKEFKNVKIIAKLPPVMRDDRSYEVPETDAVLVSNIGELGISKKLYGDYRLNLFNSDSAAYYGDFERVTLSPELSLSELDGIAEGCEIIGYGRIPLMLMENCPLASVGKCAGFKLHRGLKDRKNEVFPIKCNEGCVSELLNSKPIYMADKAENLNKLKISAVRLIFTVENSEECGKIIEEYKTAFSGGKVKPPAENTFTRGHFFRGVE